MSFIRKRAAEKFGDSRVGWSSTAAQGGRPLQGHTRGVHMDARGGCHHECLVLLCSTIYCEPSGIHHRSPGYNSALPHLYKKQRRSSDGGGSCIHRFYLREYWRNEHTQWITFRTTTASIFFISLSLSLLAGIRRLITYTHIPAQERAADDNREMMLESFCARALPAAFPCNWGSLASNLFIYLMR